MSRVSRALSSVLFIVLGICFHARAEIENTSDSKYTFRFGVLVPQLQTEIENTSDKSLSKLKFSPNAPSKTFLSVAHSWWGASLSWSNPLTNDEVKEKGETSSLDSQFRFLMSQGSLEFFYQKYKGYYLESPKILYPDLQTEHAGFSGTYVFSPEKYSMAAGFDQSSQQKESGGSWLVNLAFGTHSWSNTTSLVPATLQRRYGNFEFVRGAKLATLTAGGGFAYTLIPYSHFYLSALATLGFGAHWSAYDLNGESRQSQTGGIQIHVKAGLGYNGDQFLSGFQLISDQTPYQVENASMNFSTLQLAFFVGTRL